MPKRRIDPATGEPELTYREQMLVDEFIKNGGNASGAAASAGDSAARADRSKNPGPPRWTRQQRKSQLLSMLCSEGARRPCETRPRAPDT